jgi:hypothetical protein
MKFNDTHAADKGRFQILTIHEPNVKSFAELDPKKEPLKAKHWGGKDLSLPILLDANGEMLKSYGISGFPTTILIDPDGKVVRGGNAKTLDEILKKEKGK